MGEEGLEQYDRTYMVIVVGYEECILLSYQDNQSPNVYDRLPFIQHWHPHDNYLSISITYQEDNRHCISFYMLYCFLIHSQPSKQTGQVPANKTIQYAIQLRANMIYFCRKPTVPLDSSIL